jgi:hypothetical protein
MINIFEDNYFKGYEIRSLNNAQGQISGYSLYGEQVTTVFISHKHDDLAALKGLIGFLETNYNIKAYIDSQDPTMPKVTSGITAKNIKDRITRCRKFILLATNGAVESKWCNWELGYGDAKKYKDHIAILPLKPAGSSDAQYRGNEYMSIYPSIARYDSGDKYSNGNSITPGFYVRTKDDTDNKYYITPLAEWLKK